MISNPMCSKQKRQSMRIVFLQCASDLYGSSRCLLNLVSLLQQNGHQTLTVLPEDGPLADVLRSTGGEVRLFPSLPVLRRQNCRSLRALLKFGLGYLRAVPRLASVFSDFKADLVHTNSAVVLGGGAAAHRCGIPHLTHVRESFGEFGPLWLLLKWSIVHSSDRIVCVSRAMCDQFGSEKERSRKVSRVYDGVPAAVFESVSVEDMNQMRRHYGLDANHLIVGLVGRVKWKRKGQETFVHAAAHLVEKHRNAVFVIVGGVFPGNETHMDMTLQLIKALGVEDRVFCLGEQSNIYPLMALFDISVMASGLPEPFGCVTVESMGLGIPVVGTAIGGTLELIEDGVTGLLVPPNDPHAMAESIDRLLADSELRKKMGEAARIRFQCCFTLDRHYTALLEEYGCCFQRE